jgi:hypothetical protein
MLIIRVKNSFASAISHRYLTIYTMPIPPQFGIPFTPAEQATIQAAFLAVSTILRSKVNFNMTEDERKELSKLGMERTPYVFMRDQYVSAKRYRGNNVAGAQVVYDGLKGCFESQGRQNPSAPPQP